MHTHLCKAIKTLNPNHKKTFNNYLTYRNVKLPHPNRVIRNFRTGSNFKVNH